MIVGNLQGLWPILAVVAAAVGAAAKTRARAARSPRDLAAAAGVDLAAATSPAVACALAAAYAAPPTDEDRRLWRRLAPAAGGLFRRAARWPAERLRQIVVCVGRRGLKTSAVLAWTCVFELLFGGHEEHAAPGSRIYAVVIAPLVAQAREATRGIRAVLDALAVLGIRYEVRDAAGAPEIAITNPRARCERVIRVMSADAVAVRGFAICFAAFDEAGFLPSETWLAQTGRDIVRALTPGMAQFPGARTLFVSSPGAPGGIFHDLVTKPPADTLVIRAPTWLMNPRINRETCERLAGGDAATFAQEYEASRFGYGGESFVDTARIATGSPHAGKGARPGAFVFAVDLGGLGDDHAIVGCSSFEVEVSQQHAGVRHVVVEVAEAIAANRTSPVPIERVAARVVELARAYGDAPIVFDPFSAPTLELHLARLGYHEHAGDGVPPPGHFARRSMAPQHQTPRWRLVQALAHGGRLHVGEGHAELVRQLAQLKATQQSSGALKVEGKKDDLADALALAAEIAVRLPATGGPGTAVAWKYDGVHWDGTGGLTLRNARWVRTLPSGREEPAEMPEWAPGFESYARDMAGRGVFTPNVARWVERQRAAGAHESRITGASPLNVPVR